MRHKVIALLNFMCPFFSCFLKRLWCVCFVASAASVQAGSTQRMLEVRRTTIQRFIDVLRYINSTLQRRCLAIGSWWSTASILNGESYDEPQVASWPLDVLKLQEPKSRSTLPTYRSRSANMRTYREDPGRYRSTETRKQWKSVWATHLSLRNEGVWTITPFI